MKSLINFDVLAMLMVCLVTLLTLSISLFAKRYMQGDQYYHRFVMGLVALGLSVIILVVADNIWLFFAAWCCSNLLLVILMIHKSTWRAAKASGMLALKTLSVSCLFLGAGLAILCSLTQQHSIQAINYADPHHPILVPLALGCILIAAFAQSAILPFHRWLLSSVNSPTPVSAMMHAGLINGGGFLLIRFSPLYLHFDYAFFLKVMFAVGLITALMGTIWKLLQQDYKRMLACSTVAQMGFMMMQCGLGIFSAAVAHLCWHGFFKAYLFLNSGSAAEEKKAINEKNLTLSTFLTATFFGIIGASVFSIISGKSIANLDAQLVLIFLAAIAATQLSLNILQMNITYWQKGLFALIATTSFGFCYGGSIFMIYVFFEFWQFDAPQSLNWLHVSGMTLLMLAWIIPHLHQQVNANYWLQRWWRNNYARLLNSSQPHPTTVTAHHNHYQYLGK